MNLTSMHPIGPVIFKEHSCMCKTACPQGNCICVVAKSWSGMAPLQHSCWVVRDSLLQLTWLPCFRGCPEYGLRLAAKCKKVGERSSVSCWPAMAWTMHRTLAVKSNCTAARCTGYYVPGSTCRELGGLHSQHNTAQHNTLLVAAWQGTASQDSKGWQLTKLRDAVDSERGRGLSLCKAPPSA